MPNNTVFLGIDFGSGGCKVSAVSGTGALLQEANVEYTTEYAHPGWSEQNPADWYRAMCETLRKIRDKGVDFRQIKAVAFDGSTHNAVLLDGQMRPVRKTIMWTDQRSVAECAELQQRYGKEIFRIAGQQPAPTWTLPQMLWLSRHEPEVLQKTRHILFVKDYVRYLVTGYAATDCIEAEGTLFFDLHQQCWSPELVALAGLQMSVLPELVKPTDVVGQVTAQVAVDTGIPAGTPVVCGTSDSAVEDYGAGAIQAGDCILKLATAGNVNVMTTSPHPSATTLTYSHVIPGLWYTVSATNAAALCQRWFRDTFCRYEAPGTAGTVVQSFTQLDRLAELSAPGAGGVMFHPYLQGERSPYWDANLRASFTGVSISSGKGDFIRAIFEGVTYSLLDCQRTILDMGLPINRLFLIGGGARGKLWSEIICNVFNRPVQVPLPGDASFGSALLAATGVGFFKNSAEAVKHCLKIDRELHPNPALAEFYRGQFDIYRQIHDALAPIYAQQ